MARPDFPRNIIEFQERFPDEAATSGSALLQKLRRAMVAPERTPLRGEVEVDEGFIGGVNSARRSGRDRIGKQLVVVGVEVRGAGSGRLRLASLPDASGASLGGFVSENITAASFTPTAGVAMTLDEFVFRHNRRRTPMAGFQTLLGLSATHQPTTYREITADEIAA